MNPDYESHLISVKTSEEEGYDVTVHYIPAKVIRSETREEPAEWNEDEILSIVLDDGTELTSKQISVLGITSGNFLDIKEIDLTEKL